MSEADEEIAPKLPQLVTMQRELMSACDVWPIQPEQLKEAENLTSGLNMEKLLLERVVLRKEMRLRSMQEKLIDQTQKLEEAEAKLRDHNNLPGFETFLAFSILFLQFLQKSKIARNSLKEVTRHVIINLQEVLLWLFRKV